MPVNGIETRLQLALAARSALLDSEERQALRLFSGFYEGCPDLVVDLYARTLVLFDYSKDSLAGERNLDLAQDFYLDIFPWIECVIHKRRHAQAQVLRLGKVAFGQIPAQQISEHGVIYAIDLLMNQDASFYIDTCNLRKWLFDNAAGWQVLNTFAYTGSLGIAALAGGASHVIQNDRSKKFLALARQSAMQNKLDLGKMKLRGADFFGAVAQFKRQGMLFDCLIIDPPFFSSTSKGTVDLVNENSRLINKVRPLVKHDGWLITINNALFLSGADYIQSLESLCQDGYLFIEEIIPIPEDITGFPETIMHQPPADPTPFNHPTKIVILKVKRKTNLPPTT
jgi:23S rRNA (cytosine1962-C5)-methyltransferase